MKDYIEIGSSPVEEDCLQVGHATSQEMKEECKRFLDLIRKVVGPEVGTARLAIKSNPHDFGTYYEVVCYYDDEDEVGMDYAFKCESETPLTWEVTV